MSPGRAPLLRRALKVVMPAHSSGAASASASLGDEGEGVGGRDHVVGIAAVVVDAADGLIFAEDEVAAAAGGAVVAVASVPAEADSLARLEERHVGADGVENSGDLVAGTRGYWMPGQWPSLVSESLWHTPQAWTRMRTCPGPGSGNSFERAERLRRRRKPAWHDL